MDGISEYEMERRRKMERNHRRLQELGLVGRGEPWKDPRSRKAVKPQRKPPTPTAAASVSASASAEGVAVRKSVRARRKPAPIYAPPAPPARALRGFAVRNFLAAGIPVRKSSRTKSKMSPSYREHDTDSSDDESDAPALSQDVGEDSGDEEAGFVSKRSRDSPAKREEWTPPTVVPPATGIVRRAPTPLAPNSSRNVECDIPMLLERYLGRQFPSFGKAPVMELSTKSCPPKFSRMSGVTEWKNAVFLWVNVHGGSGYENLFERDPPPQEAGSAADTKAPGDDPAAAAAAVAATRETYKASTGTTESEPVDGDWRLSRNPRRGGMAGSSSAAPARADRPPPAGNINNNNNNGDAQSGVNEPTKETTTTTAVAAGGGGGASQLAGLRMTWFAGGRVTAESALMQRLLLPENPPEPKTEDETKGGDSPSAGAERRPASDNDDGGGGGEGGDGGSGDGDGVGAVLLFCRLPNEPYVFCGRLGYSKHWADERPIRFVWRLLDAERMAGSPDFEAVVEVAGGEEPI